MKVIRNTYPRWDGVKRAEAGDEVQWQAGRRRMELVRTSDGATVFSRDCLPKHMEDTRPMVGVVACVKNKGWFLEVV